MKLRPLILAALSGIALSACVLAVDWDGLKGSGPLPTDAGEDATDAMELTDASDAGDAADASLDASGCPDGAFCDDFERTMVLGAWTNSDIQSPNTLSITDHAFAGQGALRVMIGPDNGARAILAKNLPASTSVRVRFMLYETTARTGGISPILMQYSDRTDIVIIGLEGNDVRLYEQEFDRTPTELYFEKTNTFPRRFNEWVEVILEVTLGSTGHAKLTYAGVVAVDTNLARKYGATEVTVNAGENYAAMGADASFDIDDVQVTWNPTNK